MDCLMTNKRDATIFTCSFVVLNYEVYWGGGPYALCVLYAIALTWFCCLVDEAHKREFVNYAVSRKGV